MSSGEETTDSQIKVSVCVVTYNQEEHIRQCLQSIVDQVTDFNFEVLVSDDFSKDSAREIISEFQKKYPSIIKPIFHKENTGAFKNYISTHRVAIGDYICHIDGDDMMCVGKLQKQASFLDENPDCSAVAHKMSILVNNRIVGLTKDNPEKLDARYLLLNHPCFLNSSIMYKRVCGNEFLSCEENIIDFYLYVALAQNGFIGFINQPLGQYSKGVGISAGLKLMPFIQQAIDLAATYLPDKKIIGRARARQYRSYAVASLGIGDHEKFKLYIVLMRQSHYGFLNQLMARLLGLSPGITLLLDRLYKNILKRVRYNG